MTLPARPRPRPRALVPRTTTQGRLPAGARLRLLVGVRAPLPAWARGFAARRAQAAQLRTVLRLEPRERLLVTSRGSASGPPSLALSDRALYYRDGGNGDRDDGDLGDGDGGGGWTRLGWERVARVGWGPAGRLVFDAAMPDAAVSGTEMPDSSVPDAAVPGTRHARVAIPVPVKGNVPEIALERVGHTRLGERRIVLPGGSQVRVEARRRPVTGELLWLVIRGPGIPELSGDELRRQAAPVLARLSAEFGLYGQPAAGLGVPAPRPPGASVSVPLRQAPADDQRPGLMGRQPSLRTRG